MIIIHKDKTVCPIRKRKVDTYSYNYTGIPNALDAPHKRKKRLKTLNLLTSSRRTWIKHS